MQAVSSLKTPKEHNRVIDADWAASDRPVIVGADGCLRVFDLKLRLTCYPVEYTDFPGESWTCRDASLQEIS